MKFLPLFLSLAALGPATAPAQTPAQPSKIDKVTVYPGLATVERSTRVAGGARELVLNCLSPNFDMASLRLEADAGIRLGPVSAINRPRAEVAECSSSPLDGRIRALEDRLAALAAESGGHDLVLGYLRGMAPAEGASSPRAAASPGTAVNLQAALASIQRAGQQSLTEQNRLAREREALERELQPLRSERDRLGRQEGEVRQLRIALNASREGMVRLHYQVAGPTWAPAYRATLDHEAGTVEVERLAQVSQRSGEDWAGVALRLSTGTPRGSTSGPQPRRWTVLPQPPAPPAPPPPPMAARAFAPTAAATARNKAADDGALEFAVQMNQGEFATEFEVPGAVDVGSGAQRVNLSLGSTKLAVGLKVQTTPQADASAWLVADFPTPPGVWPDGPLQLLRGTQVVGQSVWRLGQRDRVTLPFGRDEQVRVQVIPSQQKSGSTGFIGARTERRIAHAYVVENRRRSPIQLEVLESSPVSNDEQITVTRQFDPAVLPGNWQEQPGIVVWAQTLAPGQTTRFNAEYVISHPKDLPVSDRR